MGRKKNSEKSFDSEAVRKSKRSRQPHNFVIYRKQKIDFSPNEDDGPSSETVKSKWTIKDKQNLLKALQTIGASRVEEVAQQVPTKSLLQVEMFLNSIKKKASELFLNEEDEEEVNKKSAKLNFIDLFKNFGGKHDKLNSLKLALILIKNFESHPLSNKPGDVDLAEAYEFMISMLNGCPPALSFGTGRFIAEILNELTTATKMDNGPEAFNLWNNLLNGDKKSSVHLNGNITTIAPKEGITVSLSEEMERLMSKSYFNPLQHKCVIYIDQTLDDGLSRISSVKVNLAQPVIPGQSQNPGREVLIAPASLETSDFLLHGPVMKVISQKKTGRPPNKKVPNLENKISEEDFPLMSNFPIRTYSRKQKRLDPPKAKLPEVREPFGPKPTLGRPKKTVKNSPNKRKSAKSSTNCGETPKIDVSEFFIDESSS